jgi:poly-beta-1,6-N-acetyl-D-glucosamine biosynthesis protein PgaD
MNDGLIINARHNLSWYVRLGSDATTAMMWAGWLYLWRPLMQMLILLNTWGASFRITATKVLSNTPTLTLEGSLIALLGTSSTLLLWSLLPSKKLKTAHQVSTLRDYARHFDLPEQQIRAGRNTSVCVVHHDAQGKITHIEMVDKLAA